MTAAFAAGHSLGEYSAHVAAGTLSFADALRTVRRRGQFMQEAVPVGEGRHVGDSRSATPIPWHRRAPTARAELAGRVVSPANLNAPGQVVIAGHADAVARAGELAKAAGAKRVIPLAVSAPFHCALMKPAEERLAPMLRALAGARTRGFPSSPTWTPSRNETAAAAVDALDSAGVVAGALGGRRQAADG